MTVFITSSPFIDGADPAILNPANGFIDALREALPPFPQALFICSDPERLDLSCLYSAGQSAAFALAGIPFSGYQVLSGLNAHRAQELLSQADFIILHGGHVPTQNRFFQEIGLGALLEDFDGVLMGISAGSMNMAEEVYAQPEEPGESDPDFPRFLPGLGITPVNVLPHYQKCKDDILDGLRLFEDITYADSWGRLFFALPDGSYILQDEEDFLLFGESYLIHDGQIEPLTQEGQVLNLAEF